MRRWQQKVVFLVEAGEVARGGFGGLGSEEEGSSQGAALQSF